MQIKTLPCEDIPGTYVVTNFPPDKSIYELRTEGGQLIELGAFSQSNTYSAWLDGYPSQEMNHRLVLEVMSKAVKWAEHIRFTHHVFKPYVLRPRQRKGELDQHGIAVPERPFLYIPCVATYALFDCASTGTSGSNSSALIVWFQDHWGLPHAAITRRIRRIKWDNYAHSWSW